MKLKPIIGKYTLIGLLNIFIFQWFFIRLVAVTDSKTKDIIQLAANGFILPLTGWWSDYIAVLCDFKIPVFWRK